MPRPRAAPSFSSHRSAHTLISRIFHDSLNASSVVLFASHIAQRRCAVRSFLSHPFRIKLMRTNNDSSTPQHHLPSKPPCSPALLLTYRLRHPFHVPSKTDGCAFWALPGNTAQRCPAARGYIKVDRVIVKNERLHFPGGHLPSFLPPRPHMYTTRAENRRLTNGLLRWPLEGKYFPVNASSHSRG